MSTSLQYKVDCRILTFTYFSYIRLSANILVGSPMNKFITAIKEINFPAVEEILKREPKWLTWQEDGISPKQMAEKTGPKRIFNLLESK